MSALEDSETQVNGIIMIPWGLPKNSPWHAWRVNTLMSAMPFQIKGWHSILSETLSPWLSWLTSILDQKARTRMRVHTGTYQEIMYSVSGQVMASAGEEDGLALHRVGPAIPRTFPSWHTVITPIMHSHSSIGDSSPFFCLHAALDVRYPNNAHSRADG